VAVDAPSTHSQRPDKPEPTWELVLKRNPVERLKQEKAPLGIRDELPALIAAGYEAVPEEDIVRLQWWGLYHDKPKVGTFMLRVKLPSGHLTPARLRAIGEVSNEFGRGDGELATRQNIQLHWLELGQLPNVFTHLDAAGITTAGGCGDTVRNITGCPVQGLDPYELFDCSDVVEEAAAFFYGNPDFCDLPRKHKYTIAACADRCNAPEINCVALVGVVHEGREGFAVRVGGGLSSVPRISRDLGVFVPKEEAIEVLSAVTGAWSDDLRYRVSRVKARLKFMIDDIGPDGMRERVEARIGRRLERFTLPAVATAPPDHLGIHEQKQAGLVYVGVPVHLGLISGDQMIAVADLAERVGGDIRVTRLQNFVLANIPEHEVGAVAAELEDIGFPLDVNAVRGRSIACTGEPHCNFSVTETKTRLGRLIEHLEGRFGTAIESLRLNLDGCPHSCAQHWVGDLGFQGTTARDDEGKRRQAYDIFVRGGLGPDAAIGQPLFRRIPSEELDAAVAGLVGGWLEQRRDGESFVRFATRLSDDELGVLAGVEPARKREREEKEAA
jgi:ferredoxin-nitrite reductase